MSGRVIDMVTHQLTANHIVEQLLACFEEEPREVVHVLVEADDAIYMTQRIRVAFSHYYKRLKTPEDERIGFRASDPFKWTEPASIGLVNAISIRPHFSKTKSMSRALSQHMKELSL